MGEDIAAVADSPRCAVTMAGRVSELSHTADSVQKPSVLGKLKQAQERLSHEAKNWKHTAKKKNNSYKENQNKEQESRPEKSNRRRDF
ncbi:MAG: hypothetical protein ACLRWM_00750 [Streptococcus sp.]